MKAWLDRLRTLGARTSRVTPWLALGCLWLLFELVVAFHAMVPDLSAVTFSLEVPLLLSFWGVNEGRWQNRGVRWVLRVLVTLLIVYRVDQWACLLLMHEDPMLYDQWFMLRHLLVLIGDLMSPKTFLVLGGVIGAMAGVGWAARALLRRAKPLFSSERWHRTWRVAAGLWVLFLVAYGASHAAGLGLVRWLSVDVAANVRHSLRVYRGVGTRLKDSPYLAYDTLELKERPDTLLFIVESYGRVLFSDKQTRATHRELLLQLDERLAEAGWHAASAYSTSTVSGGRSWIAEGTFLMGTPIRYESVFHHILAERPPNLVGFFNRHGYETVLLAPSDRDRAGARVVNRYGFTRTLTYRDMNYDGPPVGWGIVPDEYSLAVAEKKVLAGGKKPVFLDFHMVTSHAPWEAVPEVRGYGTTLPVGEASKAPDPDEGIHPSTNPVLRAMRRYQRDGDGRFAYMKHWDERMRAGYHATISYDLEIITRYLERREDDALIIMLGDHQPPVIARTNRDFDCPIHVLTRDPRRLEEFYRLGFKPGLTLPPKMRPVMNHAGFFSLVVRTLAVASCPTCPPPPFLRNGQALLDEGDAPPKRKKSKAKKK